MAYGDGDYYLEGDDTPTEPMDSSAASTGAVLPGHNPFKVLLGPGNRPTLINPTKWQDPNGTTSNGIIDMLRQRIAGNGENKTSNGLGDLSSILGSFSSGEKANRVVKGNFTQNYDNLMLNAQRDRNANESDALKKMAQTSYIMGGGSQFKQPSIQMNGQQRQAPSFGTGPMATSAAEQQGAGTLQAQLMKRLAPGGSYQPTDLSSYAEPGLAEKLGSYGAVGTGGLGAVNNIMHGDDNGGGNILSSIMNGAGKAKGIVDMAKKIPWGKLGGLFGMGGGGD